MPKILITGAAGFIGQLLAERLLSTPEYTLILTDIILPPIPPHAKHPENAQTIQADLSFPTSLSSLITSTSPLSTIYLFHGIMSSNAETDFDLGLRVNLSSTLAVLEAIRTTYAHSPDKPRIIYASSQAVYGQPLPEIITETTLPTPESSYGSQKLICETLINDYTRRGFIDGLNLRFPTISIRPGKPTGAASSFLSGIIREPLNGKECIVPIVDREFKSWLCSPRTLAENLIIAMNLDLKGLEKHRRVVNLPGVTVSVQEMMDALEKVGGREAVALVKEVGDEGMERILRSWGTRFDTRLAESVGFVRDGSFAQAVRDYKDSIEGLELEVVLD